MIIYMDVKVSQIKRVKSYMATLRDFDVGDTKYYKPVDTDYNGFHNPANVWKSKMQVNSPSDGARTKSIL